MNIDKFIDGLVEIGKEQQLIHEAKQLIDQNSSLQNTCGSCRKWMTDYCPREKYHKVSMNEEKCSEFDIEKWCKNKIESNIKRLELIKT